MKSQEAYKETINGFLGVQLILALIVQYTYPRVARRLWRKRLKILEPVNCLWVEPLGGPDEILTTGHRYGHTEVFSASLVRIIYDRKQVHFTM